MWRCWYANEYFTPHSRRHCVWKSGYRYCDILIEGYGTKSLLLEAVRPSPPASETIYHWDLFWISILFPPIDIPDFRCREGLHTFNQTLQMPSLKAPKDHNSRNVVWNNTATTPITNIQGFCPFWGIGSSLEDIRSSVLCWRRRNSVASCTHLWRLQTNLMNRLLHSQREIFFSPRTYPLGTLLFYSRYMSFTYNNPISIWYCLSRSYTYFPSDHSNKAIMGIQGEK